ncbi:MAG: polysulfide reductase NrfD [Chloroflexi bacterium]|nr:polysulfide reductase NrfD [Chloroflexota bacterium]
MTVRPEDQSAEPITWGKVIDNRKCIGCHACTVACKQEHDVPLGVNRTYVKQVEVGRYPNVRRHFQVTRCNQCADAPCVEICPTTAMYQRPDGIVDFDRSRCIGCQACMAACPYDAIYIDPESHSAEKCNFCTNRIDRGLQPACVTVCPTQAIFVGNLEDPVSNVSNLIAREKVEVRRPEKNTNPKVFYVDATGPTLDPAAAAFKGYFSQSQPIDTQVAPGRPSPTSANDPSSSHAAAILAYDNPHRAPWNWIVSAYTWTKSISAGLVMVVAAMGLLGYDLRFGGLGGSGVELTAVAAAALLLAVTAGLLVLDLHHPERFVYTLLKPQWRSWVTRGAYIITAYGAFLIVYASAALADVGGGLMAGVRLIAVFLALAAGVYTAFLFGQAKGRDLWQDPGLPAHFFVRTALAGVAALSLIASHGGFSVNPTIFHWGILIALVLHGAFMIGHVARSRAGTSEATRNMVLGPYRVYFWGSFLIGVAVPAAIMARDAWHSASDTTTVMFAVFTKAPIFNFSSTDIDLVAASVMALVGLALYEHAYVQAGQSVPQS